MKIEVASLKPNPFRHLARYPVQPEKVEALKRSIKDTSFWDNLLARKVGDGFEIAYGHNRLAALKALRIEEVDIPVRKLSDTDMARIMAHENMEEWGHSSSIEQETVRAIVEGYAAGKIELPKPKGAGNGQGNLRYAPHFGGQSSRTESPYTVGTLAQFLGWKEYKVQAALNALALIEDKVADEDTFNDLTTKQAQVVTQQGKRVLKETKDAKLARVVTQRLADGMKKGAGRGGAKKDVAEVTIHNAKMRTDEMLGKMKMKAEPPKARPDIVKFVAEQTMKVSNLLANVEREKLDAIVRNAEHVPMNERRGLVKALRDLAARATKFADRLEA